MTEAQHEEALKTLEQSLGGLRQAGSGSREGP